MALDALDNVFAVYGLLISVDASRYSSRYQPSACDSSLDHNQGLLSSLSAPHCLLRPCTLPPSCFIVATE